MPRRRRSPPASCRLVGYDDADTRATGRVLGDLQLRRVAVDELQPLADVLQPHAGAGGGGPGEADARVRDRDGELAMHDFGARGKRAALGLRLKAVLDG